jgi:hypothetical protein
LTEREALLREQPGQELTGPSVDLAADSVAAGDSSSASAAAGGYASAGGSADSAGASGAAGGNASAGASAPMPSAAAHATEPPEDEEDRLQTYWDEQVRKWLVMQHCVVDHRAHAMWPGPV